MEGYMKKQISRGMVWGTGLVIISVLMVAGCATTDTSTKFSDPPPDLFPSATNGTTNGAFVSAVQQGDRFSIGDQVTVKFSGTAETILPHEERIKDDGMITLPLIGAVKAE